MNKQIIAFLSLFSLVLVLSVYYVLVPVGVKDTPANVGYEATREAFFTALQMQKESRQLEYINEQSLIIVSAEASDEEKAFASVNIDNTREIMQMENDVAASIKEINFAASYVEVQASGTMVLVSNGGSIENNLYYQIFNICMANQLINPVVYNYDNPPAWLINDAV